jgi:hypothetical protein
LYTMIFETSLTWYVASYNMNTATNRNLEKKNENENNNNSTWQGKYQMA